MTQVLELAQEHITFNGHHYDRVLVESIIEQASLPHVENIVIDCFSGIGGVTEGFSRLSNYKVIACINHWSVAIETHRKNHPDCLHLQEDFKIADTAILEYMVEQIRRRNPRVQVHVWMSLECTNFSNAKGGMARDADSRTLADHADRYVMALNPDMIWIENVKEFLLWGPMIPKVITKVKARNGKLRNKTIHVEKGFKAVEYYNTLIEQGVALSCPIHIKKKKVKGKTIIEEFGPWMIPCPNRKGRDYRRWVKYICSLGYDVQHKVLNCADFGVPQHRIRVIIQFNRKGVAATWPQPTNDKKGRFGLPKWNPVRPCLDLDKEGDSILAFKTNKKTGQLVPRIKSKATIDRLMESVVKQVLNKRDEAFKMGDQVVNAHLIDHYFGNGYSKPISEPAGVSGTKDGISLQSIQFLATYHSQGTGTTLDQPSPPAMTKDKNPLVTTTHFVDLQYSQGQKSKSIEEPSAGITGVPKPKLIQADHLIMDTQFNNSCHTLDQAARTQTANRKHFYLMNMQWFGGALRNVETASNTIIARLDKAPNYLVVLETGELAIEIFPYDPPHYVRLKKFMAENGIVRITMRMLFDMELLKIQSMNPDTKLAKASTHNKKMIGNAVPPDLVEMLGMNWNKTNHTTKIIAA